MQIEGLHLIKRFNSKPIVFILYSLYFYTKVTRIIGITFIYLSVLWLIIFIKNYLAFTGSIFEASIKHFTFKMSKKISVWQKLL